MAKRKRAANKPARKAAPARAKQSRPRAKIAAASKLRKRRDPETLRLRSFGPMLTVDNLADSMRFYTDTLGFVVGERWTSDKGVLMGVSLKAGACTLSVTQDDWAKGRNRSKGIGVRIWADTVQDIDAIAARIKAAGGVLVTEPTDEPWGARTLSIDDPDGYHLTISRTGR